MIAKSKKGDEVMVLNSGDLQMVSSHDHTENFNQIPTEQRMLLDEIEQQDAPHMGDAPIPIEEPVPEQIQRETIPGLTAEQQEVIDGLQKWSVKALTQKFSDRLELLKGKTKDHFVKVTREMAEVYEKKNAEASERIRKGM